MELSQSKQTKKTDLGNCWILLALVASVVPGVFNFCPIPLRFPTAAWLRNHVNGVVEARCCHHDHLYHDTNTANHPNLRKAGDGRRLGWLTTSGTSTWVCLKVVHKPLDFGTIGQPIATSKKGQAKLVYNPIKL
jgi:hypothetical protein